MNTKIINLLTLIKENPELKILPMVNSECVGGDDYSYWSAEWGKAEIDEYYTNDERIYFKENDYDELVEKYMDSIVEDLETLVTDEELGIMAEKVVNDLKWIKAIVVHIDPL